MTVRTVDLSHDGEPLLHGRDSLWQRAMRAVDVCYVRMVHRLKMEGPCPFPRQGPGIVICNHISSLDPLLIQAASPRVIRWMIAQEYFGVRTLRWIFEAIEAIPVRRGMRDLTATRAAIRTLEGGHLLGVFPEGRIETAHELLPFQTGVAMMAVKTGVNIYPVHIEGTMRGQSMVGAIARPQRGVIRFGPALGFGDGATDRQALEDATGKMWRIVNKLGAGTVVR